MGGRLYVGSLLYQVQPEEIFKLFEDHHIAILNVDMSIDPFSGRNPSYCFVDLDPTEDAEAVIEKLNGRRIRDRAIRVRYDVGARTQGPCQIKTLVENGEYRTFELTPSNNDETFVFNRWARNDARDHWTKPIEQKRRVFVGGLSDISSQQFVNDEMRQLFERFNIEAVSKRILPAHLNRRMPATGQCYCFVDMPSAIEAIDAVEALNGRPTPYGGVYKLKVAHDQQDRKVCREQADILGIRRVTMEPKRNLEGNWRARA